MGGSDRVWQPASLDGLRETVLGAYHASEDIPFVGSVPFSAALYVWWIPLFSLFVFATRDRRWLLALIPWAIGMLVATVGPVYHPRYVLQFIYTVPLLVCLAGMVAAEAADPSPESRM